MLLLFFCVSSIVLHLSLLIIDVDVGRQTKVKVKVEIIESRFTTDKRIYELRIF